MAGNTVSPDTLKKREKFLSAYAELGTIAHAAARAGIERRTAYRWMEDLNFKASFDQAKEEVTDKLEREMIRRACEGVDKPVYYKGKLVDTMKEYSDTLLIFLAKGLKPQVYGDKVIQEHTGPNGGPIQFSNMPDDELEKRITELGGVSLLTPSQK